MYYNKGAAMFIEDYIKKSISTKEKLLHNNKILETINDVSNVIVSSYSRGGKVITAGNGGSAGDAQHIAGELVSKFYFDRPGLAAVSLTTDTSIITAIGNDYGYEKIFARQIQANGNKGDVFIGISTSGNSKNILLALEEAKKKGIITVGLTGSKECLMDNLSDYIIKVPSDETPNIQEAHIMIGHIICALVEKSLFKEKKNDN